MKKLMLFLLVFLNACPFCLAQQLETEGPSLEEKIGQMLMVGFRGFEVSDTSHIVRDVRQYHLGGVVLFDYDVPTGRPQRNINNPDQVRSLITGLQALADIPLFIAVDQEGGRVARLKPQRGFRSSVSAQHLGEMDNPDSTRAYASSMAGMLQDLGFNVDFAPVVDLNVNPDNPVIGRIGRSFSADPDVVIRHASIFLKEFSNRNILGVLKHFPGHGSAWNDSHVGIADVSDTWKPVELEPYRRLIKKGYPFAVMTAHVFNENLDPKLPATLSTNIQTKLLRDDLGFKGVLFSDDMQMQAIRSFYGLENSIEYAIKAGVDVITFANNSVYQPDIVPRAVEIIKNLIGEGKISEERIDRSYQRIMAAKRNLKLLN